MQSREFGRIAVALILAIAVSLGIYYCIIVISVDPYLESHTWKLISNNFDTYRNTSLQNEKKIYVIGNSQVMSALEPALTRDELLSQNFSSSVFDLGVNFDTPLQRSIELRDIIGSKPEMVIYGLSYCSFSSRYRYVPDDNIALVSEKIHLDDYSRSLFDKQQLALIDQSWFDQILFKRKFIIPSLKNRMGIQLGGRETVVNDTLTYEEKQIIARNPYDEFLAPVDAEDNVQKMAFLHIRDELAKNNISFVYIHMPMDSLRVATIPQSTKTNYFNFLNSTGVRYYNLEQAYPDGELYDLVHLNKFGREKFSRNLADLLIKGLL